VQECVKALRTNGISSHTLLKESESANLELFSEKTYKESLVAKPVTENQFSNMSSESWNKWVTKQRQEYSQRKKLALLTKENESSSWGTPNTMDMLPPRSPEALARAKKKGGCKNLREEVIQPQNWPTIQASEARQGYQDRTRGKKGSQKSLTTVVVDGLQDQANSNTNGKSQESWPTPRVGGQDESQETLQARGRSGSLSAKAAPNPSSAKLNPNWVEQLMGLPVGWTQL
jgi:hypothetical protein